MSKLTIVIDNIPEEDYEDMWKKSIKNAKAQAGTPITKTDTITIDYTLINENYPKIADMVVPPMLSGIFTCHLMCEADKILNK